VAPVMRELVVEKVTSDVFWWVKAPDALQAQPWQQDWGVLGEAYVLWLLEQLAIASNCEFRPNLKWNGGELDAAIWFKGHVALIEITTSTMSEVNAFSGDWQKFRSALHQTFVESTRPGKPPYKEAVLQLSRDVKMLVDGSLSEQIPIKSVQRAYPVLIALDRKLRVPGAWHYLNEQLITDLGDAAKVSCALAPLNLEDVEELEQLMHDRRKEFGGTPPGLLRILRRWDTDRGVAPSWWQFMNYLAGNTRVSRHLVAESAAWKEEIKKHFTSDPWAEDEE
jgi:hypothetical protein